MNRFLRTAYATTFVYLFLSLFAALMTGVGMPFSAPLCLYFGLLLILLPGAMPALRDKGTLLRLLGVLLALLGFLPLWLRGCSAAHGVAHGLGILAAGAFVPILRHRTTHSDFAAKFRFSILLLLVLIAYMYLSLLVGITEEAIVPIARGHVSQALDHLVPIFILLLMTGVLLLRGLRGLQGTLDERAFNRRQLRDLLLYASLVGVAFVFDPLPRLFRGLSWLLGRGGRWLVWAFGRLLDLLANKEPKFDPPKPEATPDPAEDYPPPPVETVTEQEPAHYKLDEAGETTLYKTILYIFLAAAAAVLLAILILEVRKLIRRIRDRGGAAGRGYPNEIRESLDGEDPAKRGRRPKRRSPLPRLRIRYLYGAFLRFLRRVPLRIEPCDTCGRINERAGRVMHLDRGDLSEFREIYEQARYCEGRAPSEQDAARMKKLFDRLKRGRL